MRYAICAFVLCAGASIATGDVTGYYRQPSIWKDTIVFVSEGDLWKADADGGAARRLTSHPGDEGTPQISPDGETVAFTAQYEGPTEVYTMPISGGLPVRRTFDGGRSSVVGWAGAEVLYATDNFSTLPNTQLVRLRVEDPAVAGVRELVPLWQASDGAYDGGTLYFTRLAFQGSQTKRYTGGTAQNIWKWSEGDAEAAPLTADYPGTSRRPMVWRGRVYFASDRDGTMNIWSMRADGSEARRHTDHSGLDVLGPSLHEGRIVYQHGADLRLYDISLALDKALDLTLETDLDQTRENWVEKPMDYASAIHLSPDGDRVVITARGAVFVAPQKQGRFVRASHDRGVRYRDARFMPDGKSLIVLSDRSGEVELWKLPANGVGEPEQLTSDSTVLRWEAIPSPDGKLIAHQDKDQRLFVFDTETRENKLIDTNEVDRFPDIAWSPDSKWIAYTTFAPNMFRVVKIYSVAGGVTLEATTDRFDSFSPAWSTDGNWLYLLSDRNLRSVVASPWGNYQPEPFLDKTTKVYHIALTEGLRSPFAPRDEVNDAREKAEKEKKKEEKKEEVKKETEPPKDDAEKGEKDKAADLGDKPAKEVVSVTIDIPGLQSRLFDVPIPPGNYSGLSVNEKALLWLSRGAGEDTATLQGLAIGNEEFEVKPVAAGIASYEMSGDGKKLLIRKGDALHVLDAAAANADLKKAVDLSAWSLSVVPREEWGQMYMESWRLMRDHFYDPGMHGVDWKAMLEKYRPLAERVTTRAELSDVIAQMVGELSALHHFVRGGDVREGPDKVQPSLLGAELARDESGYRVVRIYAHDPDEPERASPLARPGVGVGPGDVIESVDGVPALSAPALGMLLRSKANRQVLLRVRPADGGEARDVIVRPLGVGEAAELRYHEWEHTRRLAVEEGGGGDIGYVHLRAMGGGNFTEWAKGFYPAFNRKGLIIDVRHNRGGNIDSWIIGRLLRRAWFTWSQRVGKPPNWNMQYAFRGHVVVLCNERTASDGEAFAEGIKRLRLGTVLGTRTWGGEIWLSSSNFLVDGGIATAAEYGVFGPEGAWLIEGWGVEPDIVVDNLPHATFTGEDAQLQAAIELLRQKIAQEPIEPMVPPEYPDKSRPAPR